MKSLIESIISKLHYLSQPRLQEVLDFVEFLTWQEETKNQSSISNSEVEISDKYFEFLADQVADQLTRSVGANMPSLSDYAVSRQGIYEEHP